MKSIKRIWSILKVNIKEIILFELLYRIFFSITFLSVFSNLMTFAIKKSGYSYLTAKNIGGFFLQPYTIPITLWIIVFGIGIILVETSTLLAAFQASERDESLNIGQMFMRGLKNSFYFMKKRNLKIILVNLLIVGFANWDFIYKGLFHVKPLSDIAKGIQDNAFIDNSLKVIILLVFFLLLPCIFTIHFCLLNKKNGREAFLGSFQLVKNNFVRLFFYLLLCNGGIWIFTKLVLYLFTFLLAFITSTFVERSIRLALFLTAFDWLELGIIVFGGILSLILNLAFLSGMYYQFRDQADMAPELLVMEDKAAYGRRKHRKTGKIVLTICAGLFLYCFVDVVSNGIDFAKEVLIDTQITAHRGSSNTAPENTIVAIELAIEEMADYVEIDVQESMDGVVIVLHDKSFKRTCGVNKVPWRMNYSEILELDAGYYRNGQYSGVRVPTLEEVLELCKRENMNLNIELKNNGHNTDLVGKVLELLAEYDMENHCVLTSTSLDYLKQVKEKNPDLLTGYIVSTVYGAFYKNDAVDFFSANSGLLNERNVEIIHESGREVHAWTVNSKTEIERMKRIGVDNIITDYPVLVREILYREADTESLLDFMAMVLK